MRRPRDAHARHCRRPRYRFRRPSPGATAGPWQIWTAVPSFEGKTHRESAPRLGVLPVLEFLQRLLYLDWRRHGAAMREVGLAGSRVWYADFTPRVERPSE